MRDLTVQLSVQIRSVCCPVLSHLGVFHQHVLSGNTDIAEAQEAVVVALVAKLVPYVPHCHPCKSDSVTSLLVTESTSGFTLHPSKSV